MALKPLPLMSYANGLPVAEDFWGLSYVSRKQLIMFILWDGPEELVDLLWSPEQCSVNSTVSGHNPSG